MGCDYYIQCELVIEYKCKDGRINTIYTNRSIEKGYVYHYRDQDSDDDDITCDKKFKAEIERRIKKNTYNKMLFQNGAWVKESYKTRYEADLIRNYKDIEKIMKIYKKKKAWERH